MSSASYPTHIAPEIPATTDDFGMDVVARSADAERKLITHAWLNPEGAHDCAVVHEVGEDSFADRRLGHIFAYVLYCATKSRAPDVYEVTWLAQSEHIHFDADSWLWPIILYGDTKHVELEQDVEVVRFFADRRNAIRSHLRNLSDLLSPTHEVCIRPAGSRAFVPRRLAVRRTVANV